MANNYKVAAITTVITRADGGITTAYRGAIIDGDTLTAETLNHLITIGHLTPEPEPNPATPANPPTTKQAAGRQTKPK